MVANVTAGWFRHSPLTCPTPKHPHTHLLKKKRTREEREKMDAWRKCRICKHKYSQCYFVSKNHIKWCQNCVFYITKPSLLYVSHRHTHTHSYTLAVSSSLGSLHGSSHHWKWQWEFGPICSKSAFNDDQRAWMKELWVWKPRCVCVIEYASVKNMCLVSSRRICSDSCVCVFEYKNFLTLLTASAVASSYMDIHRHRQTHTWWRKLKSIMLCTCLQALVGQSNPHTQSFSSSFSSSSIYQSASSQKGPQKACWFNFCRLSSVQWD